MGSGLRGSVLAGQRKLISERKHFVNVLLIVIVRVVGDVLVEHGEYVVLSLPVEVYQGVLCHAKALVLLVFQVGRTVLLLLPMQPRHYVD